MEFFASAAKGTEPALRDELRELRFSRVRADRGGVHFEGELREGYRACLWSRIAVRVLTPVARFDASSEKALYDGARAVDLERALSPRRTLVIRAATRASRLTHTEYLCQLTKDAVVDRIRDRCGERPSVDKDNPDVSLFLHLVRDVATLYLDLSGEPLHRRSRGPRASEAPLKETLAAALIRYSGWDRKSPFADPFSGSGTLLCEAGLWARNVAPGLTRAFGFERWESFDASASAVLAELRDQARSRALPHGPELLGRDVAPAALDATRDALARAGLKAELSLGSVREADLSSAGAIVANPPYGKRLHRSPELGRDLAGLVDRHPHAAVALLLSEDQAMGRTRRRPSLRALYNGAIPCQARIWQPR